MKVERVEPKKKKRAPTNWYGRLIIIVLLAIGAFAIWKLKTAPPPGVIETEAPPVEAVQRSLPYKPLPPVMVDPTSGRYAIPLMQGKHTTNILIYQYGQHDRRLLFNEPVIVTSIQKATVNDVNGLAITIVRDDTNSNGTLDIADIRQLIWFNGETGAITTIKRPLYSFLRLVPAPKQTHLVFEVGVDINRNGRTEATDPKQYLIVELPDTVLEMLPESVVPTLSIPTKDQSARGI